MSSSVAPTWIVTAIAGALAFTPLVALSGCSDDAAGDDDITVLAAASLTDAFTALAPRFEADHDGTRVTFSFGGSSALVEQANAGAPGDVLVTADEATMARADGVGEVTTIARNRLAIMVEAGNPKGIEGLADLARDGIVVAMCAIEVPCGRIAAHALQRAGVTVDAASLEQQVRGVAAKVLLGEADAGIVYVTDVLAAGAGADGVAIGGLDDPELEAVYQAAVLDGTGGADVAREWVAFVAGPVGRAVLADHGFLEP